MLELGGAKRKSARISALEASKSNKKKKNNSTVKPNIQFEPHQPQEVEAASLEDATPSTVMEVASGSGQKKPLPKPKRGPRRKRLDEVAGTSVTKRTRKLYIKELLVFYALKFLGYETMQWMPSSIVLSRMSLLDVSDGEIPKHDDPSTILFTYDNPANLASASPLPEKHILEFVIDILQRRDTNNSFAQPVDPQKVVGYYHIIKEPMDFGTMQTRLQEGMYKTLEAFESDVLLICKNAMHFNSSATIYFRQARAIHELAKRVFHVLRTDYKTIEHKFSVETRQTGRKPQGRGRSLRTRRGPNVRRSNQRCRGSSNGSRDGNDVDLPARRETHRLFSHSENESIPSGVSSSLEQVSDDGRFDYRGSLMRFVKDLGPTAQKVADQKLARSLTEPSNYQFQTPMWSVQDPRSLIASLSAQWQPPCAGGATGSQVASVLPKLPEYSIKSNNANDQLAVHYAATKGMNVLTNGGLDIYPDASRGTVSMAFASDRVDKHSAASKGKSILTMDNMDTYGGTYGEKMAPSWGRMNTHGAFQGKTVPPTELNGSRGASQGERPLATYSEAIDFKLPEEKVVNTLGVTDAWKPFKGMNQPSNQKNQSGLVFPSAGNVRFNSPAAPADGITDAGGKHNLNLLQGVVRDDTAHNYQNRQNNSCLPRSGAWTLNLNTPPADPEDASSRHMIMGMMVDSSQVGNQVQPTQFASGSMSSLLEFMARKNGSAKSSVHPSRIITPSRSTHTTTLLHDLGSHSLSSIEQADASLNPCCGSSSDQVNQPVEWSRSTPWGPQTIYNFSEIQPQLNDVNPVAEDALVQEGSQSPAPYMQLLHSGIGPLDKDMSVKYESQLTPAPQMQPGHDEMDQAGQDAFGQDELQLALASFKQPEMNEMSILSQDALAQAELQFTVTPYTQLLTNEANSLDGGHYPLARYAHPQSNSVNALGLDRLVQQEPQLGGIPYNSNSFWQEALVKQPVQPRQGLMHDARKAYVRPVQQIWEGGGISAQHMWNGQEGSPSSTQYPDLSLQLRPKHPFL
ncbi:unnamed protein product [Ilex paraguariensis]|uniref:Bromo domain-containing protein n=1 Tax=Ilex paraguariensis TaxID=185542 RepID=A0ABC8UMM3_9AQUA